MADQDDKNDIREREYNLLDPELLKLIGHAASFWATLEHYINSLIWDLADVPPAFGACMTAQIFNINGRLNALLALLKIRRASTKTIDAVNKFADEIRGPSERRNRIVHDPWGRNQTDGSTTKIEITANKKLKFEIVSVDLAEVKKDVDMIIDSVLKFVAIKKLIEAEIPTLPDIPEAELRPVRDGPPSY